MLREGNGNDEIIDFMVARYGDFVLYRPPVNQMTYLLWYGPFGLLIIGLIVMWLISGKRKRKDRDEENLEQKLSDEESQRLKDILDDGNNK